jgi:hypothetical protein
MDSRLISVIASAQSVCLIDNVPNGHVLKSNALVTMLTSRVMRSRPFHNNRKMESFPNNTIWMSTGNAYRLGGDLERRCYTIAMRPPTDRPYERSNFRHADLRAWVRDNRERLLSDLFTIAVAWVRAGKPRSSIRMGSFEEWSAVIGGVLEHAGVTGFLGNFQSQMDNSCSESVSIRAFLQQWHDSFGVKPKSADDIQLSLMSNQDLQASMPHHLNRTYIGDIIHFKQKLGKFLASQLGRQIACYRVERTDDLHKKVALWAVIKDPQCPTNQPPLQPVLAIPATQTVGDTKHPQDPDLHPGERLVGKEGHLVG